MDVDLAGLRTQVQQHDFVVDTSHQQLVLASLVVQAFGQPILVLFILCHEHLQVLVLNSRGDLNISEQLG